MKNVIFLIFVSISFSIKGQSCDEIIKLVKKEGGYGTTYTSINSDAISKVTFYRMIADYKTLYFAIVCFKKEYSYSCTEYIYQVASNTSLNYAGNYLSSAGKAFWTYIQPYNENLGCAPNFKQ
jgi:hypothetical protein